MKVLVIGKNSYIAQEFVKVMTSANEWELHSLSVRDDAWLSYDYSSFDSILFFAAIVHHPEITDEKLYQRVNVEIPYKMASLAKERGVRQFVYISTCAVWGNGPLFAQKNVIDTTTPLAPETLYGKSKAEAELRLAKLESPDFHVARVRLPNVYGVNCPGTFYHRIEQLSHIPLLPIYKYKAPFSLISVENVAKALRKIVSESMTGVLCPQDLHIQSIVERIAELARRRGKRQIQTKVFWPLLWFIGKVFPNKYLNNLYGEYYIDPISYPVIVDSE